MRTNVVEKPGQRSAVHGQPFEIASEHPGKVESRMLTLRRCKTLAESCLYITPFLIVAQ
jgi:hypothetical protein